MDRKKKMMLLGGTKKYWESILSMFGTSVIGYWKQDELSGTTAADSSPNKRDITYDGGMLNQIISPRGNPARDNSTPAGSGGIDAGTTSVISAFNGDEGTIIFLVKMKTWATGATGGLCYLLNNNENFVYIYQPVNAPVISFARCAAAQRVEYSRRINHTNWIVITFTWSLSGGYTMAFENGLSAGTGVITEGFVGSIAANNSRFFAIAAATWGLNAYCGDTILLNRTITAAEARRVADLIMPGIKTFAILGDSISEANVENDLVYWRLVLNSYNDSKNRRYEHAASGANIVPEMATQAAATVGESLDICIIALGTNDNNAGNMATLQATVESGIDTIRTGNPNVTIYYMNVLPRFDAADKANIRTAIAAACTAKGVVCWDTTTDPWIEAADTADNIHPNEAGYIKIANRILALLP